MTKKYKFIIAQAILLALPALFIGGCSNGTEGESNIKYRDMLEKAPAEVVLQDEEIAVEAPPFSDGIFPCTECHAYYDPNPVRRELVDMHEEISATFDHDEENRWCLDCHDMDNRDSLRFASGKLLDFKESYKLCGQCHGDKLRDWKVGVHGKRKGEWDGKKEYLLCVNCHNPHSPKFEPMVPEPPPIRQEEIK